jgi:hypothetical protein
MNGDGRPKQIIRMNVARETLHKKIPLNKRKIYSIKVFFSILLEPPASLSHWEEDYSSEE